MRPNKVIKYGLVDRVDEMLLKGYSHHAISYLLMSEGYNLSAMSINRFKNMQREDKLYNKKEKISKIKYVPINDRRNKPNIFEENITIKVELINPNTLKKYKRYEYYRIKNKSGVYFLFKDDELVYIGSSRVLKNRLKNHNKSKYNKFGIIYLDENDRFALEYLYIRLYKPPLNFVK